MQKKKYTHVSAETILMYILGLSCVVVGILVGMKRMEVQVKRGVKQARAIQTIRVSDEPTSTPTPTPRMTMFHIPILMYHYVEYVQDKGDTIRQSLDTSPYLFEQQVKTLVDGGYTFLTAKDFGEILDGKQELPQKPVVLTFDDGYRDFYTDAFPILKKYQAKATVYMIAGFVDFKNNMTEQQLKEVAASGLVDVGAHTVHHVELKYVDDTTAQREIWESKRMLELLLGKPVVSFAYPDGAYTDRVISMVSAAGYTTAVSTTPGIVNGADNRYALLRLRSGGRVGEALLQYFTKSSFTAW